MKFENFPWPPVGGRNEIPVWTGSHFEVGSNRLKILSFRQSESAWSSELTEMHEKEASTSHPIDLASRAMAVQSMKRLKVRGRPIILDVGCSSGLLVEDLIRNVPDADVIGADYILEIVWRGAQRLPNNPFLQFDLRQCPLAEACVDGVTALNVLEHIDDDLKALTEIYRILKRGGLAHIEVPADPDSFDLYDEVLLHYRRYRLSDLIGKARSTGFAVQKATHLGFFVYPIFRRVKKQNQKLGKRLSLEGKTRIVVDRIRTTKKSWTLKTAFDLERLFGSVAAYPVGIRAVVRLEKP